MPIIQDSNFANFPGLFHGFTTRTLPIKAAFFQQSERRAELGAEEIEANRRAALAHAPAGVKLALLNQVHVAKVIHVHQGNFQLEPDADAHVSNDPNIILGILTADCVPVLFYDPSAKVIGAAHAGWRGTLAGVLAATIAAMEELGAKASNCTALVGPCIHQQSYEVGPEVRESFIAKDAQYAEFFSPSGKPHHYMFDLPGVVKAQLATQQVASITQLPENTYTQPEKWHSFRLATHQNQPYPGSILAMIGMAV